MTPISKSLILGNRRKLGRNLNNTACSMCLGNLRGRLYSQALSNARSPASEMVFDKMCVFDLNVYMISQSNFFLQIRDSLFGNSKCSLEDFTVHSMHKYRPGSLSERVNNGYMIHNALLVSIRVINTVFVSTNYFFSG